MRHPLIEAVKRKDTETALSIIRKDVSGVSSDQDSIPLINAQDRFGRTALHWAIIEGANDITQALLKVEQINVNAADSAGNTALHFSAQNGAEEIVDALLTIPDILVDAKNADGWTASSLRLTCEKCACHE